MHACTAPNQARKKNTVERISRTLGKTDGLPDISEHVACADLSNHHFHLGNAQIFWSCSPLALKSDSSLAPRRITGFWLT